ncbi:hypothetical protein ACFLQO_01580 [Candidatus Aenigmatarchaeota archaeon]
MNKTKLKALLAVLTVALSLSLTVSVLLQNQENICHLETQDLVDEREMAIYYNNMQLIMFNAFLRDVDFEEEQFNKASGFIEIDMQNFTRAWLNFTASGQATIFILNDEISNQRKECNNYSIIGNIFLYVALIINVVLLLCSIFVYQSQ